MSVKGKVKVIATIKAEVEIPAGMKQKDFMTSIRLYLEGDKLPQGCQRKVYEIKLLEKKVKYE